MILMLKKRVTPTYYERKKVVVHNNCVDFTYFSSSKRKPYNSRRHSKIWNSVFSYHFHLIYVEKSFFENFLWWFVSQLKWDRPVVQLKHLLPHRWHGFHNRSLFQIVVNRIRPKKCYHARISVRGIRTVFVIDVLTVLKEIIVVSDCCTCDFCNTWRFPINRRTLSI